MKKYNKIDATYIESFRKESKCIGLVDGFGRKLKLGIPPNEFIDIIQTLINQNQYEYIKNKSEKVGLMK